MTTQEFIKQYSLERHGTNSLKWDDLQARYGETDLISMWVADMEFKTSHYITDAMKKRIEHGVFGYSRIDDEYFQAFSDWMTRRFGWPIEKEWIRFSPGVVTALYWMVNCFTKPGDSCMILTPVYYPFHNAIKNTGRKLVTVDLTYDRGYFTMNFEAIEKAIIDNNVKLFIQSSPHNPAGRVWTEQELDTILSICHRHHVLVISDEIHQDIVTGDKKQIPAAIVHGGKYLDNLIVCSAASKTFNLAGLLHSHIIIPDKTLRDIYDEYAKTVNQIEVNIMGIVATQAGYEHGEPWLEQVLQVIRQNYEYVKHTLAVGAPKITVTSMEGTYLCMLDLREYVSEDEIKAFIQGKCRLAVDYGEWFGEHYKGFVRLNLATDPKYVQKAMNNIVKAVQELK